jgi:hypothetical protein
MILDRMVVRITAVSIPCRLEIAEIMFLAMPAIMRAVAPEALVRGRNCD